ncbi:3,4-dihydroxy-2-butanone 4-phosphate synthase / GTP cyclohydrolase II [invertebrate metagenome]|uniref:GTP cyclohydrolase II n=1 Tax=invertebrate metagenome TaxID=1711999 RepID=A0A484H5J7_9ZZZZ
MALASINSYVVNIYIRDVVIAAGYSINALYACVCASPMCGARRESETDYRAAHRSEYKLPMLTLPLSPEIAVPGLLAVVDHAVGELRRGGFVILSAAEEGEGVFIMQAAEAVTSQSLGILGRLSDQPVALALTLRRAMVLGLVEKALDGSPDPTDVVLVKAPAGLEAERVLPLAEVAAEEHTVRSESLSVTFLSGRSAIGAAVRLVKLARLLPAAVLVPRSFEPKVSSHSAVRKILKGDVPLAITVKVEDINTYDQCVVRTLRPVSEAQVPLAGAENVRLIAFRPSDGGIEHLAIIVGIPDSTTPVLVRLHSECFTGDLLDSLRCDCGSQLRGAIAAITAAGAGVLLYLAQEGRGIGLVNKLRAYQLQDRGFDTLEANGQLGFDDDERTYMPAAEMLRQLGFCRVRLMTNNPHKVEALVYHGIEVTERIPHIFPANAHNLSYIQTKSTKGNHIF